MFSASKKISAELSAFQSAVLLVNAIHPAGGCTPDEILSLLTAHHMKKMDATSIDYLLKNTPHTEWKFSVPYKILRGHLEWQEYDGPVSELSGATVTCSSSEMVSTELSGWDIIFVDAYSPEQKSGRKNSERPLLTAK